VVEEKEKLSGTLDAIYQVSNWHSPSWMCFISFLYLYQKDEELRSKDGSTECLCVVKKYPLHQRFPVFVEGLGMSEALHLNCCNDIIMIQHWLYTGCRTCIYCRWCWDN
jgi:hypothetical protein